jgi:hypothetical protein
MLRASAAVLVACGTLAAAVAGTAGSTPQISVSAVRVASSSSSATVTWTTSVATRGRVSYGVGGLYLYSPPETSPTTAHTVTLDDLTPSTTYEFSLGTATGRLTTDPLPAHVTFGVDGTRVTADGSLFFPILSYWQCAGTSAAAVAAGINAFIQAPFTGCLRADPNNFSTDPPPPSVHVLSDNYATAGAGEAGWYLPDEPDGWGIAPEQMPRLQPAAATGRLRVLNISQHFFSEQAPINDQFDRNDYKRFAALGDLVGFDMYPIVKFCGRIPLIDVFRAQRELMTTYAPGKPTFQWIETGAMTGECATMTVTPATANAETWLAIAGGACGIGYFTNSWTGDLWNRWDLAPGIEEQLGRTTAQIRALAPALCGGRYGDVTVPWNSDVAASSRALNDALYVIAVNSTAAQKTIPFRVDLLAGRKLSVVGESRTITPAKKVFFRDTFAPYQVHVYVAAPR